MNYIIAEKQKQEELRKRIEEETRRKLEAQKQREIEEAKRKAAVEERARLEAERRAEEERARLEEARQRELELKRMEDEKNSRQRINLLTHYIHYIRIFRTDLHLLQVLLTLDCSAEILLLMTAFLQMQISQLKPKIKPKSPSHLMLMNGRS